MDMIIDLGYDQYCMDKLSKKTDVHYAHLTNVINSLMLDGILTKKLINKKHYVVLTEKGKALSDEFITIRDIIENKAVKQNDE